VVQGGAASPDVASCSNLYWSTVVGRWDSIDDIVAAVVVCYWLSMVMKSKMVNRISSAGNHQIGDVSDYGGLLHRCYCLSQQRMMLILRLRFYHCCQQAEQIPFLPPLDFPPLAAAAVEDVVADGSNQQ